MPPRRHGHWRNVIFRGMRARTNVGRAAYTHPGTARWTRRMAGRRLLQGRRAAARFVSRWRSNRRRLPRAAFTRARFRVRRAAIGFGAQNVLRNMRSRAISRALTSF